MKALDRIWNSSFPVPETGCWIWTGGSTGRGYGQIYFKGKRWYAHRLSFAAHHRDLLPGEVVRHTCDTPCCVNPNHLKAGSQRDNLADAKERGRLRIGESNPNSNHSDEVVLSILRSEKSDADTAREIGVTSKYVWLVRNKKIRTNLSILEGEG